MATNLAIIFLLWLSKYGSDAVMDGYSCLNTFALSAELELQVNKAVNVLSMKNWKCIKVEDCSSFCFRTNLTCTTDASVTVPTGHVYQKAYKIYTLDDGFILESECCKTQTVKALNCSIVNLREDGKIAAFHKKGTSFIRNMKWTSVEVCEAVTVYPSLSIVCRNRQTPQYNDKILRDFASEPGTQVDGFSSGGSHVATSSIYSQLPEPYCFFDESPLMVAEGTESSAIAENAVSSSSATSNAAVSDSAVSGSAVSGSAGSGAAGLNQLGLIGLNGLLALAALDSRTTVTATTQSATTTATPTSTSLVSTTTTSATTSSSSLTTTTTSSQTSTTTSSSSTSSSTTSSSTTTSSTTTSTTTACIGIFQACAIGSGNPCCNYKQWTYHCIVTDITDPTLFTSVSGITTTFIFYHNTCDCFTDKIACSAPSDCCSNSCVNGICAGGPISCLVQGDCPAGYTCSQLTHECE